MSSFSQLELADAEWAAFVASRPEALPFHNPAWASMVADTYALRAFVVAVRDPTESISAGIPLIRVRSPFGPRRLVALPFTDRCPPLASDAPALGHLVNALEDVQQALNVHHVEVRADVPEARAFAAAGYHHVLDLDPDPAIVFSRFHRSQVQRSIRKAESSGLDVRVGVPGDDLLDDFYTLHLATRRRLGVPIQPRRFFALLRERILNPGLGWIVSVESGGRPVAAAVFLASPTTIVYKFGASDARAWPSRPNHLLFWHAIRSACESGHLSFDFGRSDADAEGLRAFKRSWGADERVLRYSAIGDHAPFRPEGAALGRRLATTVIRRAPLWVCRLSGEVLYRVIA